LSFGFKALYIAHSPPHGLTWLPAQGQTCAVHR